MFSHTFLKFSMHDIHRSHWYTLKTQLNGSVCDIDLVKEISCVRKYLYSLWGFLKSCLYCSYRPKLPNKCLYLFMDGVSSWLLPDKSLPLSLLLSHTLLHIYVPSSQRSTWNSINVPIFVGRINPVAFSHFSAYCLSWIDGVQHCRWLLLY